MENVKGQIKECRKAEQRMHESRSWNVGRQSGECMRTGNGIEEGTVKYV